MPQSVLVVEDEPNIAALIRRALEVSGYTVFWAGDAAQAMELLRQHVPDVLVCDWSLPGVDGGELVRRVRAAATLPQPSVIMIAALAADADPSVMAPEADAWLRKPFNPSTLVEMVRRFAPQAPERGEPPGADVVGQRSEVSSHWTQKLRSFFSALSRR